MLQLHGLEIIARGDQVRLFSESCYRVRSQHDNGWYGVESKFIARTGFERMKHTANVITVSLDLFFKKLSLSKIVDHLQQFHDTDVSDTAIYWWMRKYVALTSGHLDRLKPRLSGRWHADETWLMRNGFFERRVGV